MIRWNRCNAHPVLVERDVGLVEVFVVCRPRKTRGGREFIRRGRYVSYMAYEVEGGYSPPEEGREIRGISTHLERCRWGSGR